MNWKKTAKCLLFPRAAFVWMFAPASLALLVYSAVAFSPADVISIASYACSFYALILVVLRVPQIVRFVQRFRRENRYAVRYASDVQLRINISLHGAVALHSVYAAFQLGLGFWHHSVWFYSMAGYYLLLAVMRLMLAKYTRVHAPGEQQETEWKKYRFCGVCLLIMTLTLSIFVTYFIWRIREFRHHEITTIAMAAYTFFSLTLAIVNVIRYRNYGSPAYSAAKAVSLVSALVSLLTLENAMLTAFGQENGEGFRRIMLTLTGIAVIFAVQGIAIYMIVNSGRKLKAIHHPNRS